MVRSISILAALALNCECEAVIVISGDGSGNTTAPADDPGFANVGNRGVYLGNRWVLTANHVGAGAISLGGISYGFVPGSAVQLSNPDGLGLTPLTDLLMFRIDADPGLPSLSISQNIPAVGSEVIMIGDGRNRETDLTYWDVVDNGDDTFTWTEGVAPGDESGYKWAAGSAMRWGENTIADDVEIDPDETDPDHNFVATIVGVDVVFLGTVFDDGGSGLTHESHAASGDSGGGLFYKNGADWELAGIMNAIGGLDDQPAETAVFGNFTASADLSIYRDQIVGLVVVPEPSGILAVIGLGALVVVMSLRRSADLQSAVSQVCNLPFSKRKARRPPARCSSRVL